jgi:hypothetical protein
MYGLKIRRTRTVTSESKWKCSFRLENALILRRIILLTKLVLYFRKKVLLKYYKISASSSTVSENSKMPSKLFILGAFISCVTPPPGVYLSLKVFPPIININCIFLFENFIKLPRKRCTLLYTTPKMTTT